MATRERDSNMGEAEKKKLMCSVCLEPYRQPKLLPCFHTFCTPCLQQLAASTTSGPVHVGHSSQFLATGTTEKSRERGATGGDNCSFACPTCRKVVVVLPGGVEEFLRNFKMEAALASAASESLTCEMCDNSSTATIACVECQKRLCALCQRFHDQVAGTKYHNLISLESSGNQATEGPTRAAPQKFCKTHNRQELVFRCCSCDVIICSQCLQSSHKGHQTEDLAVASERIRAEVRELLGKLEVKVKATKEVIAEVNKTEQDLERQRQGVIGEAVEAAGKVAAWANQAEENLVKEVDKMAAPLKAQLQSQKTAAREDNAALVQIQDRAKLVMKNGTYAELQSLRSDIERSKGGQVLQATV
ncbi:hypothetical protein BaRGS_00029687 [Batillaria attramentaria]|uniref:E3 ubiquitin-protein ligase TRIM56-like n=1 Tax=Batillaria attramentaria TaxID=370345 RepID=A0ABD0JWY8_9CAEN